MKVVKEIYKQIPEDLVGKTVKVTKSDFLHYNFGDIYKIAIINYSIGSLPGLLYKDENGSWREHEWNGYSAEFSLVQEEEQLELFV